MTNIRKTFMMKTILTLLLSVLICFATFGRDFSDVEIKVTKAAGKVFMLQGAGGNIGVLATKSGLLLVDDQFAPLAGKIEKAMKDISSNELKYIVNTHFHGDHTGGNTHFSKQAPVFAHQNVRERLSNKEAKKQVALPVVTYEQGVNIFLSNEEIKLSHYPNAHTDGDTVVYFKNANVLHTGDLFFELGFPYVDLNHGGSVKGYLAAVNKIIQSIPDDIVIIPGHGKLTNKARYQEFANMIDYSIKRIEKFLSEKKTDEQILALGIGKDYQQWSWRFINEEKWLKTLITDLK